MEISNSRIQCFKTCRRKYWLKYIEGLEPVQTSDALERGKSYHTKVEQIFKTGNFEHDENIKSNAMAEAFRLYLYPKLKGVQFVEKWFRYSVGSDNNVIGRVDALTQDGVVVEHKTTYGKVDETYKFLLETNEQILTYMTAFDIDHIIYTACSTPTIRQMKNETDEQFEARCLMWYEIETDEKICMFDVYRDKERLEQFKRDQSQVIYDMTNCSAFYRFPNSCMRYGRLCEYSPICLNYQRGETYLEFTKREETTP